MADYQITCINLSQNGTGHEHITHVGNGSVWRSTVAEVVAWIKSGTHSFFVMDSRGNRADVRVVERLYGAPYLRTYRDGIPTDNLLALTSCPR